MEDTPVWSFDVISKVKHIVRQFFGIFFFYTRNTMVYRIIYDEKKIDITKMQAKRDEKDRQSGNIATTNNGETHTQ